MPKITRGYAPHLPPNPNAGIDWDQDQLSHIVLAGGCFWGTQAYLARVPGVAFTEAGYANGHTANPTYEAVCTGNTGFAEAVFVKYDPRQIPLEKLLREYFKTINPTSLNKQGNDVGSQYRTGIYFLEPNDEVIARSFIKAEQMVYPEQIVVEVEPLSSFYLAEEHHQDYLEKNPGGYCHVDLSRLGK